MNDDPHTGWEILPYLFLGVAWFIGFVIFNATGADKNTTQPRWLRSLQGTFLFFLGARKGLVIVADRLTQSSPDLFPLAYIGLFVALFAPFWMWNPEKGKKLTYHDWSLVIFYLIPVTFIFALGVNKDDAVITSHFWFVPILIVAVFLLIAWIFKKEQRGQVIIASLLLTSFVGWMAVTLWVATWIS